MIRFAVLLTILCACTIHPSLASEVTKPDPVVGRWVWMGNGDVTVNANGTCQLRGAHGGTWTFQNNKEVERKYVFTWTPRGRIYIDQLRLSADGKKLEGKNQQNHRVWATRVP
jgi:hypothetical protein